MQFNQTLLDNIILHATTVCSAEQVGAVKLHKVLYFLDMVNFAQYGSPFFGGTYKKRPYGPTCAELPATLRLMEKNGLLDRETVEYFGLRKKQYTPKQKADLSYLTSQQSALLEEVIEFVCRNNSAKSISEFSHNAAWEIAEFGDTIPYHSAFLIYPTDVSLDAIEWADTEENKVATQEQGKQAVGVIDFGTFRSRVLAKC